MKRVSEHVAEHMRAVVLTMRVDTEPAPVAAWLEEAVDKVRAAVPPSPLKNRLLPSVCSSHSF